MQMALGLILICLLRGANIIADNNKSVFILLRRLSARQFPQLLLSAVLDSVSAAAAAVTSLANSWRSPLLLAGHSAANPRPSLLSIDGTDRRTLDRSYTVSAYCAAMSSCCSADSKRPHRCCQLTNTVGNIDHVQDIPITGQWTERCSPKLTLSWGPRLIGLYEVPLDQPSPRPKRISVGSSILASLMVTNRQTRRHCREHRTYSTCIC